MEHFYSKALPYIKRDVSDESEVSIELDHDDKPVVRNLQNGLAIAYLVDQGDLFNYVQQRHLAEAGVSKDEVHAAAMKNLRLLAKSQLRVQPHGNIYAMFLGGNFEASLILVDELWVQLKEQFAPNGVIIAIPARDVLAFADSNSVDGVRELRDVVSRLFPDGDHLISQHLYQRVGNTWTAFDESK